MDGRRKQLDIAGTWTTRVRATVAARWGTEERTEDVEGYWSLVP